MTDYHRIATAIDYIHANFRAQPDLEAMAQQAHWSAYHFQRKFQEWAGVSPKKFLQFLSLDYAKNLLRQEHSVAAAAYDTGLSGAGRLHDLFVTLEAMTPGEYRQGGAALSISYSFGTSPFGLYVVASTAKGICKLAFLDDADDAAAAVAALRREWPQATLVAHAAPMHAAAAQAFAHAPTRAGALPLHIKGTPFQLKVWEALLRIPEGRLATYAGVAAQAGHSRAVRAAASAVAGNPVGYLIPCHRVIRQTGALGDYRWGARRKMALVGWEAARVHGAGPATDAGDAGAS